MIKVGLVFGGKSSEHKISIISARAIYKNLDKERFEVVLIGITKNGEFYTGEGVFDFLENGIVKDIKKVDCNILTECDVIFPALHGPYGEDGTIQGMLEFLGIPYVGCGVEASAICMHKGVSRDLFKVAGIPQPDYIYFSKAQKKDAIEKVIKSFKLPVFVKPCRGGSSIGISKVKREEELENAIVKAFNFDSEVIVEEGVNVSKELEVAVLGNNELTVSPPGGLIPGDEFYTYKDKYIDTKTRFEIPANIPVDLKEKIRQMAEKAFKIVKGKGMARIDFLYNKETNSVLINEINTIPGFTEISMYPKLMALCGYPFEKLTAKLIELALSDD